MKFDYDALTPEARARLIDFDGIVAEKFKGKKLPRPVSWMIKKFIHVDYLNEKISHCGEKVDFCIDATRELGITVKIEGIENVPKDGRKYTFASNHPLGGADGLILGGIIGKNFGEPVIPVNDFLMAIKPLAPLCIPINKTGGQARNLGKRLDEAFSSDKQVLMFPAGLCSRKTDGVICDLEWKKTFITKSRENGRDIVPIHFIGENSKRFYRIANFSKRFLKFNLAMAFLPDELYRARGKCFRVVIGKPIPIESLDNSKSDIQWAEYVKKIVYELE